MKVYITPPQGLSRAMTRVANALAATAPQNGIEVVKLPTQAELIVLHVIGYPETLDNVQRITESGRSYAIIQYCMRTTQEPKTGPWLEIWKNARFVWSYYDLPAMIRADGHDVPPMNFVMTPLGADPKVFRPWDVPKKAMIMTSGYVAESETVREAAEAVRRVGGRMIHLGPGQLFEGLGDHVAFAEGINDGILGQMLSRCYYVAGLRRGEGFELPAVEGLFCGARPICYDAPHYEWFRPWAKFITEGSAEDVTDALEKVFREDYVPLTKEEIAAAVEFFSWDRVTNQVWQSFSKRHSVVSVAPRKHRLIWCGDAVIASGFARATHKTLESFTDRFDVQVIGLNYMAEPHNYPYRIHPAISRSAPQDGWGIRKLAEVATHFGPDVIVVQNDPWNVPRYLKAAGDIPVIAALAVDGANMAQAAELNKLRHAIFWTRYGLEQAQRGGYTGSGGVVPLGVALDTYRPIEAASKATLRLQSLPRRAAEGFVVGNVNRNQPRKRLDLTVRYFCEWVREYRIADAFLFLHVAPTGDRGYDVAQLMAFYGMKNRLILSEPEIGMGITEEGVAATYNIFDVQVNTGQGEGWGLTTMEGMACGVPQIAGDWSALGEWAKDAAHLVPCTTTSVTPDNINVIGGIPDEEEFVKALHKVYSEPEYRQELISKGLALVNQPQFRWEAISEAFLKQVEEAIF